MSFVCEYIPEEDIARYGLQALWREYGYDFPEKAEWVRDRERDLYLARLGNLVPKNPDEDWIKHHELRIMYWNGQKTVVRLLCTDKDNLPQGLYYVNCWFVGFHNFGPGPGTVPTYKEMPEFIARLKEALTAYGQGGLNGRVPRDKVAVEFWGFDVRRPDPDSPFVCEYIPEADIARYSLKELWKECGGRLFFPSRPEWVRDHERDMFLTQLRGLSRENDYEIWLMRRHGRDIGVKIYRSGGDTYWQRPYHQSWSFVGFDCPGGISTNRELPGFIASLKEALTAYGAHGVDSRVPPGEVVVNFYHFGFSIVEDGQP